MKTHSPSTPSDFQSLAAPERILLGPGPSMAHPAVLKAMSQPLVGHLDPYFLKVMDQVQEMLRYVFQTRNPLTFAVSGTGTAAMETAVANMVEPGDSVLVCANGYFGLRIAEMVERYGGDLTALKRPWGEVFDLDEIESALQQSKAKVVAIVHAETSTGARQPLEGLAEIVHNHGAVLIVDAVTSLGGLPLLVDEWDLDLVYSGTQKCLGCPPGLGPITLGPRAAERLHARKTRVQNWYLDLTGLEKYWGSERAYHHTAPISSFYGLHEGLRLVAEEGLEGRWERHRRNAEAFWEGLERISLECHVPEQNRLPSLTTVRIPAGVEDMQVRKRLLEEYNIEIAGGFGELKGVVWRVGFMGYSSRQENVELLLNALRELVQLGENNTVG
jgi:alanine-glyoxylate transaminase / serine-glyoxylate transaminase / serine-pyruvate transaminase